MLLLLAGFCAVIVFFPPEGRVAGPLHEWLATRSPEYLKRHFIPTDESLWHMEKYENFLIERRKLLKARIQEVFLFDGNGA